LIALVGLMVPRSLRTDWRQEWETELRYREMLLAEWDRLDWRSRLDLLRRSTSAFWDALWLQRRRLETDVIQDLRYGIRMLLGRPASTAVAVLTLALGVGANTAIFTLLDKTLIQPLPVDSPHQLVTVVGATGESRVLSYPLYVDLRDRNDVLSGLVAYHQRPVSLSDGASAERVTGLVVSGNYFAVLGVRPALGRFFLPEEDRTPGTHAVTVVSHGLWRRRFGADPGVIGRTVVINGYRYTVVGITPAEFTGTTRGTANDLYIPAMMQGEVNAGTSMLANRNAGWLRLIGRLEPGVSREQAQAALAILADEQENTSARGKDSKDSKGPKGGIFLADGSRGNPDRVEDLSLPLKLMMGVVGCVLLVACANIANLQLARASTRSREIAVRLAVGAGRMRIIRQLLTESAILSTLGGAAGLLVAHWLIRFLLAFQERTSFVSRSIDGALDGRALGFTLGLSLLTGLLFSLAPALQASRTEFLHALERQPSGAGRGRRFGLRGPLVAAQLALSLVILIGAALCLKSLRTLQAVDPGLEPAKVVTASLDLGVKGYDDARGHRFISQLSEKVSALPGVELVSFAQIVAFSDLFWIAGATVGDQQRRFDFNAISPDYFRTLGTPLVSGREFTRRDTRDTPNVVVVNEAAVRHYWAGRDPVGTQTSRGEVVGVVRDSKEKGLAVAPSPAMYLPILQTRGGSLQITLHARTATDPQALLAGVRREIQSIDPSLAVFNLRTLADQKEGSLYVQRMAAALLTLFALLAVLVSAVGVYGVLSYAVTERTYEIGIRLAHGAQSRDLIALIVGQGMAPALIGLAIGLGAAFASTRLLQRLLFGVGATDPMTFVAVPVLLAAVALLACWIPARRATRLSPLAALRYH
jgi:predicted permease